ncbi:LOW QUALITY PROTEIN: MAM and LDL-receptor class A domain-containing protein 1-like, partial [Gryllus bimaculatus]
IIFEGIWGPNRAGGTLAIDDIAFYEGNCTNGYIFFDIFATNQVVREVRLVAGPARPPPGAPRGPLLCFTFWFAAFGAGDSTHLSLLRYPTAGDLDDLTPHT